MAAPGRDSLKGAAGGDKSKGYTGFTPEERNNIRQAMTWATSPATSSSTAPS